MFAQLRYPLGVLIVAVAFLFLARLGVLPSQEAMVKHIADLVRSPSAVWLIGVAAVESIMRSFVTWAAKPP